MAWEQRSGKRYYYRKKREGNRIVSKYIGRDLAAQYSAESDRLEQEKLLNTLATWQEQKSRFKEFETDYEYLMLIVRGLVRATFLTSGYHPYKGQWRKKRYEQKQHYFDTRSEETKTHFEKRRKR